MKPSFFSKNNNLKPAKKRLRFEHLESRRLLAATDIQVFAAGRLGSESISLEVEGVEVQRWQNIGGNFDTREYATYSYTHPTSVEAGDVVVRMVDSAANSQQDLRVDGIRVDGTKYESESPTTWSDGGWDNDLQAIFPSYGSGEFIFTNGGAFEYSSSAASTIRVFAAGATNSETMRLWIGDQVVETWNNVGGNYSQRDFNTYSYISPTKVNPDEIRVEFTNDGIASSGQDRNLRVDAISIDGRRWETESPTTFSTATWTGSTIEASFPESESLHGSGYFQYSAADVNGSQIILNLAGSTGEETADLQVLNRVVSTFTNIGGDYDQREFTAVGFAHPRSITISDIGVAFTNDGTSAAGDRNLRIDAVELQGIRYEAEAISTLSTGTWQPLVGVQPGFWQSESLHADGLMKFGNDVSQTGTLSLASTQYSVNEAAGAFVDVEFIRTGGTLGALTLDYTTLDGTAIAGQDYVASNGTVVFNDGQSSVTVRIAILDDNSSEGTHSFNVAADRVTGGAFLGQPRTTTVSIFDDEAPGQGNGNGLRGDYFDGINLTNLITSRTDDTVDFDWGTGSPQTRVPVNNFSVRWTGEVLPRFTETYTFETRTDDGVRLWVNNVLVIDSWTDQAATFRSGQISLQAGVRYDIRMEYYEKGGDAVAELRWSSPSEAYAIIPESQLFGDEIGPDEGEFTSQTIVSGLSQPTAIDFAEVGNDDLMYIAQKDGNVRLAINGVLQSGVFLDYTTEVNNVRDRGLLGLAVHPDFVANPYVYILYTYDPPEAQGSGGLAAPDNFGNRGSQLTRVTADASTGYQTIVPGSAVVLLGTGSTWDNISNPAQDSTSNSSLPASGILPDGSFVDDILITDSQSHTIGAVNFAPDGSLYVTNGDGTSYGRVDPRTTRVQQLDSLSGKLLRINPLTGEGYSDNPFFTGDITDDQSKVLNYGLRNPFRFAIQPGTGVPYIGDVGWTAWEEINAGIGENFGWPYYEGGDGVSNPTGGYSNLAEAQAFYNSGAEVEPAVWARSHSAGGVAIVMGDFYTGTIYPELYQGSVFFTDYGDPTIRALSLDSNGEVAQSLVVTGSVGTVVEMSMGPDGYLYYVDIQGTIGRFEYTVAPSAAASLALSNAVNVSLSLTTEQTVTPALESVDNAIELLLIESSANESSSTSIETFNSLEIGSEASETEQEELENLFATI